MGDEGHMVNALVPLNTLSAPARHRARLAVATRATDIEDCRVLLDMLGLLDDQSMEKE